MISSKTIVITGPTAAGKTEMAKHLMSVGLPLIKVVTTTTRAMRSGEVEDISYHFVIKEHFEQLIHGDQMLEWTIYNGHYYGIQKADFQKIADAGKVALAVTDIPGALRMMDQNPQSTIIFLAPDNLDIISRRLAARGMSKADIESRLAIAREELKSADKFDYRVENRDGHFEETLAEVTDIVTRAIS